MCTARGCRASERLMWGSCNLNARSQTQEGRAAVEEAIEAVKTANASRPLKHSKAMARAASDHLDTKGVRRCSIKHSCAMHTVMCAV